MVSGFLVFSHQCLASVLRDALVSDKLPGQLEDWGDSVQVLMDEIGKKINQQYEETIFEHNHIRHQSSL